MPAFKNHTGVFGVPNNFEGMPIVRSLSDGNLSVFPERNYTITGVTRDLNGAVLGSCIVRLFNTEQNVLEQTITSDASGNYSFTVDKTRAFYAVSYKTGAPDVTGATVNTLMGA